MTRQARSRQRWRLIRPRRVHAPDEARPAEVARPPGAEAAGAPSGHPADDELRERIATARWHTVRYDSLRASLTTRASFIVSVNAVVVAGVALLLAQSPAKDIAGGRIAFAAASLGAASSLFFSALSIQRAMGALIGRRKWRALYGEVPSTSDFYQHSDTLRKFETYASFRTAFQSESLQRQLDSAVLNLWVVMRTHSYRYGFLRKAITMLGISISVFVVSSIFVLTLRVLKQLL